MRTYRSETLELLSIDETLMSIIQQSNERFSARWNTEDQSHLRGREYAQSWWMRSLEDEDDDPDGPSAPRPRPGSNDDGSGDVAPIARADALAAVEGVSATGRSVLANDKAAEGSSDRLFVAKVNGTEIGPGPTVITLASGAIVTMYRDGRYTYDQNGAFEHIAGGDQAVDSFRYTVSDGHGGTATATVRITITGINDTPNASDVSASASEDGPAIPISAIYSDPDSSSHTFGAVTTGTLGSVQNNNDGTYTYNPNGAFDYLAEGETATDTFRYTISDGNGVTVFRQVTITITGDNDDPTARDVAADVGEDGPAVLVAASFTDVDTLDSHTFAIDTTGTIGLVVDNGDGTFTYDPAGGFAYLAGGETATDSFTYTVDDGNGGVATGVVTVTIHGADEII
jgi:VCBS repeat-containing protein